MPTKKLVCENCVNHCRLTVTYGDDYAISDVEGNSCPYGIRYAHDHTPTYQEVFEGLASISKTGLDTLKVKSSQAISPDLFPFFQEAADTLQVDLPVRFGQVLLANVCDSGVDLIAASRKG